MYYLYTWWLERESHPCPMLPAKFALALYSTFNYKIITLTDLQWLVTTCIKSFSWHDQQNKHWSTDNQKHYMLNSMTIIRCQFVCHGANYKLIQWEIKINPDGQRQSIKINNSNWPSHWKIRFINCSRTMTSILISKDHCIFIKKYKFSSVHTGNRTGRTPI